MLTHPTKILLQDNLLKSQRQLLCFDYQNEFRKLIMNDVGSSSMSSFKITQSQWIQCFKVALDRHRYYLSFGITLCHQILSMNSTNNRDDSKLSIIFNSFSSSSCFTSLMNNIKWTIHDAATMDLLRLLQYLKKLASSATVNLESSIHNQQDVDDSTSNIEDLIMKPLEITLCNIKKIQMFTKYF